MFWRILLALLTVTFLSQVNAGIVVGGTRLIYPGDKSDVTLSVFNKETKTPYLLQVWVDPFDKKDKTKPPFIAIPPVSRLEPGQEKFLRIIKSPGELPGDRESVFWLNVKSIPPTAGDKSQGGSTLEIAIKARIKLFWRPASVNLIPERAAKEIIFSRQGNKLIVKNPTAIHVNIMDVLVNGKDVPLNMIPPFTTLTLVMPSGTAGSTLTWRFINDYGAISAPLKQQL
ncbi:fimbrial chaperone [Citrobacter sp. Igbk 14]|uniref:fimbrial chaperone n=1 Tax=Citrobacter sp. Igbk 14 TaxID=2963960 RepID=UPI002303B2F4|nr:fimbrial chaperone [Citrobacter sp. Igbk 14]MDA8512533.1 fimbrial chaperone [Citrobacter sp. Igbk 14]